MTTKPLRIAMLCVHSCPMGKLGEKDTGGMSVYVRELAYELGNQGHHIDVYTRAHDRTETAISQIGNNARLIHLRAGKDEKMEKLLIYPHLDDFACRLEKFRKDNQLQYDVIHSHYWLSGWVGQKVQRWWNSHHVTTFHTLGAVKNKANLGYDEPDLRIETERQVAIDCHRVIATSRKEREELLYHYGITNKNIGIVPCGVNLDLFRPIDKDIARKHLGVNGERLILFVGRIDPLKGLEQLLTAVSYLDYQGINLLVVGGDESCAREMQDLKALCHSMNVHESVTFVGRMEQKDLPFFYAAADVCVMPSYYESFGLVPLESLACGTPVVATRVGAVEDVIRDGETGYIVDNNQPDLLAGRISDILSQQQDHGSRIAANRESIIRFGWKNVATSIQNEYTSVISNLPSHYS
ncbi:MAG: glycosyltransferase [Chloroflexota bacterium]|nr:glycosyltransferase [Chloroflexota bacterium]